MKASVAPPRSATAFDYAQDRQGRFYGSKVHEYRPNRAADPEYIVRLVGQVIGVSVETVCIVKSLPALAS